MRETTWPTFAGVRRTRVERYSTSAVNTEYRSNDQSVRRGAEALLTCGRHIVGSRESASAGGHVSADSRDRRGRGGPSPSGRPALGDARTDASQSNWASYRRLTRPANPPNERAQYNQREDAAGDRSDRGQTAEPPPRSLGDGDGDGVGETELLYRRPLCPSRLRYRVRTFVPRDRASRRLLRRP